MTHLNLVNVEYLPKTSSSPTNVYFAKLNGENVAIKAYVRSNNIEYDKNYFMNDPDFEKYIQNIYGLDYEERIYREIIPIMAQYSPNFVEHVSTHNVSWKNFIQSISEPMVTFNYQSMNTFEQLSDLKELYGSHTVVEQEHGFTVTMVITKKTQYITSLSKVLSSGHVSEEDVINILFQLIYNLSLLQVGGIMHNDLHASNILVDVQDQPITLYYKVENNVYNINTRYVLKFFDWDLSYINLLGSNKKIENRFWYNLGIFNSFTPKFDLFTIICYMNDICSKSHLSLTYCNILSSLIKDPSLKRVSGSGYDLSSYWMKGTYDEGFMCRAKVPVSDGVLDTPYHIIIKSGLFDKLKVSTSVNTSFYQLPTSIKFY